MSGTPTITRTFEPYTGENTNLHCWSISINGQRVSELWVAPDTGEILNVWTHEHHRANGYATALYRQAATEIDIYHAPPTHRFDDGDRFAHRVGGPSMPDCTTCCAHLHDEDEEYGDY